ncbi:hypothetical protein HC864_02565 [Candidatus Gracilibacteria bacterium]|nr:hypothetical protein [Candidatus Gracilibacteria bacterium]
MSDQSIFSKFTNLYSLTKTLRFELKPVGKTLENMKNNLGYDIDLQTFLKDQEIEDAYNLIKPELDKIHEEFINEALTLNEDSDIDFESYFNEYKKSDNRDLKEFEKNLRSQIDSLFIKTSEIWKTKYKNKYVFKKGSAVAKSFNILLTKDMVKLVKDKNISNEVNNAVGKIYSFYGYLAGYNQNRENYYTTKDEKATAIATRIVHDNLPKYCDNLKQFEKIIKRKKNKVTKKVTEIIRETKLEYLGIYEYVKSKEIDPTLLKAIDESFFEINNYRKYLSQSDIEKYNGIIGDYNYLINLYNQHKKQDYKELKDEDKFQSLPQFKTLYKQIGCGKKDALFFAITHDSKEQSQQNKENFSKPYSLQELLLNTKKGVEKLITADQSGDGEICNVNDFINYILQKEDYEGLYWSKKVMNTISNLYIGNWFHVQELCQKSKVFGRGSKKENYKVIIPEAIPLTGLFEVLDSVENWREVGLFKVKAYEDEAKQIIFENTEYSASQTLLRFIVEDIKKELDQLKKTGDGLVKITDYKNQDNKDKIKAYLDSIKKVLSIIQYFSVNESKIKMVELLIR